MQPKADMVPKECGFNQSETASCARLAHTCQLLRIFRKLYGFFVPLRAYGRRGISLRIFLFTKS